MKKSEYSIRYCPNCKKEISIFFENGKLMAKNHHEKLQSCGDIECIRAIRKIAQDDKKIERQNLIDLMQSQLKKGTKSIISSISYRVGAHGFIYRESTMDGWVRSSIDKEDFCRGIIQ